MNEHLNNGQQSPHFNNWPNAVGFDTWYEERSPVELSVEGNIPAYVCGTLFRTGLGPRKLKTEDGGTFRVSHWFDSFSQVHRFQINPDGHVMYTSRLTSDGLIEKVQKTGALDGFTFAKKYEPCKSLFKKAQAVFVPSDPQTVALNEHCIGVTITPNYPGLGQTGENTSKTHPSRTEQLTIKTDAAYFQLLNPETLEPVGFAKQTVLHPELKGNLSAAHAEHDPVTGDIFNYNLEFGLKCTYRVFRTSKLTGRTAILAAVDHTPAYIHSMFLTDNYTILCVWNSTITEGGASIALNQNLLESIAWDGSAPTTWFVIDKRAPEDGGQGLVGKYESDPFFCFHSINAYEEVVEDGINIIADLAGYEDLSVLDRFYYDNMLSNSSAARKWSDPSNTKARPSYRRYCLPAVSPTATGRAYLQYQSSTKDGLELPMINPFYRTKKYRYFYGINDSGLSTFADSLVKYDVETHETKRFSKHGHTGGEPIFVPDPASEDEDGGVLLSVVLDGFEGKSYLLILDARTLEPVAKAHVDGVVGMAFHGVWTDK